MNRTDLTKKHISDSLKILASKISLEKITVRMITEQADVSRQAFYYNFADREELIIWTFRNDLANMVRSIDEQDAYVKKDDHYPKKPYYFPYEKRDKIARYWLHLSEMVQESRRFYLKALGKESRLQDYLFDLFRKLYYDEICECTRKSPISPIDADFLAEYFTCASIGYFLRWVKKGMPNIKDVSEQFLTISHDLLQHSLRRLGVLE